MTADLPHAPDPHELVDRLPALVYVETIPGDTQTYPGRASRRLGHELRELLGCGAVQASALLLDVAVHVEDRATVVERMGRTLRHPPPAELVVSYRIRVADGEHRWYEDRSAFVRWDGTEGQDQVRAGVLRDVTGERATSQRLAELERQVQHVEAVPVSIYRYVDGVGFEYVTRPMSGWTPADYVADPELWRTIIHPLDRERVRREELAAIRDRTPLDSLFRSLRPDGEYVWLLDHADPVDEDGAGNLVWQGHSLEVTELVEARRANQLFAGGFSALLDELPVDFYRLSAAEARARPLHPEDRDRVLAAVDDALAHGTELRLEYREVTDGGQTRWIVDHAQVTAPDATGEGGWAGVRIDVTELRSAQTERERLLAFLDQLIDHGPGGIYAYDDDGFTYVNVPDWSGYRPEQFYADREFWKTTVAPEDRDRVVRSVNEAEAACLPYALEYRYVNSDGALLWVVDHGRPYLDARTGRLSWFCILVDNTAAREAQTELDWVRSRLTPRELQVLALLGPGRTNAWIAGQLTLSERTVHHHVAKVLARLGLTSRAEAAVLATRHQGRLHPPGPRPGGRDAAATDPGAAQS